MGRGFYTALYTDDTGVQYYKQVDADQAVDPSRGWALYDGVAAAQMWPQRARPRMVYGVSPTSGRRGKTIVGHPAAPLWTGVAATFVVETNNPVEPTDTMTVTRRRGESFPIPHPIV